MPDRKILGSGCETDVIFSFNQVQTINSLNQHSQLAATFFVPDKAFMSAFYSDESWVGPTYDHTTGVAAGFSLYARAKDASVMGSYARINSEVLSTSVIQHCVFPFEYEVSDLCTCILLNVSGTQRMGSNPNLSRLSVFGDAHITDSSPLS